MFRIPLAAALLAVALSGCGSILPASISSAPATGPVTTDVDGGQAAARAVTAYRQSRGLSAVRIDPTLTQVAEHQAAVMARTGTFSHEVGGALPTRLRQFSVRHRTAAENLSAGAVNVDEVMRRWQASPGHNANLLMPEATRIGFAQASTTNGRFKRYWVMVLAD
ncbi:CAP domain-containing protein [Salinarimonas soli]|nr:CAP domain-containing protein [Salinarimonas soli]